MLHQAASAIRDLPQGSLETEQMRTQVYHHIYEALNMLTNYAFKDALSRRGRGGGEVLPSPASAAGRGGVEQSLADDLDFLK